MPAKVIVNAEQIAISDGSIDDRRAQGFFVRDTRLLSYYEISLNCTPFQLLASSLISHRIALYQFTNPELTYEKENLGFLMLKILWR